MGLEEGVACVLWRLERASMPFAGTFRFSLTYYGLKKTCVSLLARKRLVVLLVFGGCQPLRLEAVHFIRSAWPQVGVEISSLVVVAVVVMWR